MPASIAKTKNQVSDVHYIDEKTGETYDIGEARWCSDKGNSLAISNLPGIARQQIDTSVRSIWRYGAALPVKIENPVSLGEGCTPLIDHPDKTKGALLKLEWFAPTGSFKDRGASVVISYLRQLGISEILEDSSGNGGSAYSAYCAAAGIKAKILSPAYAQPSKIAQIKACGANVELVPGTRGDCEQEALRQAENIFYASHNWHPFFLQGTKTLGYELWEDLGFCAPDNIIIPMGAGSNVMGCDIAFRELLTAGEISRLPRLFCAQPQNCAPIHAAFQAGTDELVETVFDTTIAEGTAIKNPVRLKPVLDAIRRSKGGTVVVAESEIIESLKSLSSHGIFVEPTSAIAAAAYDRLINDNQISREETTVVVLTGSGLKATSFMTKLFCGDM